MAKEKMKTVETASGRVMVTLKVDTVLVMRPNGWQEVERVVCHIINVGSMRVVSTGLSIKSVSETDHSDEARARAGQRAFARAISRFAREDRKKLGAAFTKSRGL